MGVICSEMINVNHCGITLKSGKDEIFINFEECAKNYAKENSLKISSCIAARDITTLTFIFYTNPKTKLIFNKGFFKSILYKKSAVDRFIALQKLINDYGYRTYDLS